MTFLPLQPTEDDPAFAKMPDVGFFGAIGLARQEQAELHDPTPSLVENAIESVAHGKSLTSQQYEDSEYKRPGINFPNGASEMRARMSANRFDQEQGYQSRLSGMPNGWLKSTGEWVGGNVGWLQDPINFGASEAAAAGGAVLAEPLMAFAGTSAVGTQLARFAIGSSVVGAAVIPGQISDLLEQEHFGGEPSMKAALEGIGINAALGGLIHLGVGVVGDRIQRRAITKASHEQAVRTGLSQLQSDRRPQVDNIIQNGAYQQDLIDKQVGSYQLNDQPRSTKETLPTGEEVNPTNLDKMTQGIDEAKSDLEGIDGIDEIKSSLDEQKEILENANLGKSIDFERLEQTRNLLKDVDLNKFTKKEGTKIVNATQVLDDNLSETTLNSIDRSAIKPGDIQAVTDNLKSPMSDLAINPADHEEYKQILASIPDDDTEDLNSQVKGILNELPEDLKTAYKSIPEFEKQSKDIGRFIKEYADCVRGL